MSSHLFFLVSLAVGLSAPFCWALSNLQYHRAARSQGDETAPLLTSLCILLIIALTGTACLSFCFWQAPGPAPLLRLLHRLPTDLPLVGLATSLGISSVAGNLFLRRAFRVGQLALIGPISECCAPLAVLLGVLTGARVAPAFVPGLVALTLGVALVAISWERRATRPITPPMLAPLPLFAPQALARGQFGAFSYRSFEAADPDTKASQSESGLHRVVLIPVAVPLDADLRQPLRFSPVPSWRQPFRVFVTPGVGDAFFAALSFAWLYYAVSLVSPQIGASLTAWYQQVVSVLIVAPCLLIAWGWQTLRHPWRLRSHRSHRSHRHHDQQRCQSQHVFCAWRTWAPIVLIGLTDTAGWMLYAVGTTRLSVILVASLSEFTTIFTVVLACLFQRERLTVRQWLGIVITVVGVLAVSAVGSSFA
jgi:drug/metabolite transporter (DMT)-like permease